MLPDVQKIRSTSKHKFVGGLGHTTEPDTGGLVYMRARYYDPAAGRFVSEDPSKNGDNWYAYCNNNPVNLIDENGREGAFTFIGSLGTWAAVIIGLIMTMYFVEQFLNTLKNGDPGTPPGAGGIGGRIQNPEKSPQGPPEGAPEQGSKLEGALTGIQDSVQSAVNIQARIIELLTILATDQQ